MYFRRAAYPVTNFTDGIGQQPRSQSFAISDKRTLADILARAVYTDELTRIRDRALPHLMADWELQNYHWNGKDQTVHRSKRIERREVP